MTPKRKVMVVVMVITFAAAIWAAAWSLPAGEDAGTASQPARDESKITAKEESTGAFEKGSEENPTLKKKKFPWLLVSAGAVAAGVIVYFTLVKKPEYKLTVAKSEGVDGNLINGVTRLLKGKSLSYSFCSKPGYTNIYVLLDGQDVPAQGVIMMDQDHYLQVSASEVEVYYRLSVSVSSGVDGTLAAGDYTYKYGQEVFYNYRLKGGYKNLQVTLKDSLIPASGSIMMNRDLLLIAFADKIDSFSTMVFDEQGTWLMVEQLISGGKLEYTLSFRRDSNSAHYFGHVDMQGGQPSYVYLLDLPYDRIVNMNTQKATLDWFTRDSDYSAWRYMGNFVDESTVDGCCLNYNWPSGGCLASIPYVKSTWTMTKVSGTTSRR